MSGYVHAVLHLAGDGAQLATLVASNGRIASTLGLTAEQLERDDVLVATVMAAPTTDTLDRLGAAVANGTIRVPITQTYDLANIPEAFRGFSSGTVCKLAVRVRT